MSTWGGGGGIVFPKLWWMTFSVSLTVGHDMYMYLHMYMYVKVQKVYLSQTSILVESTLPNKHYRAVHEYFIIIGAVVVTCILHVQ